MSFSPHVLHDFAVTLTVALKIVEIFERSCYYGPYIGIGNSIALFVLFCLLLASNLLPLRGLCVLVTEEGNLGEPDIAHCSRMFVVHVV